jgi:hypothetical protein
MDTRGDRLILEIVRILVYNNMLRGATPRYGIAERHQNYGISIAFR